MRLISNIVGQPLRRFDTTKVLTQAVCDAIKGYRQAHKIGILHRYISEGNILIVDSDGQPFQGMLVDFDYAFFYREATAELGKLKPLDIQIERNDTRSGISRLQATAASFAVRERRMQAAAQNVDGSQVSNELKERTGTLLFMAIAFLNLKGEEVVHFVQHDLESFYWVLVWIVLRNTRYTHPDSPTTCDMLFGGENECVCKGDKLEWISSRHFVDVKDNQPLTLLLLVLTRFVARAYNKGKALTYESVLTMFENVLASDDWPKDDKAIPVQHIDTSKEVPVQNEPDVEVPGSSKRRADTEYPAVHLKKRRGNGEDSSATLSRRGHD
ncbi:hypothetical protein B0H21DRAFT_824728 [Amylocystis lapponica]|nr:hypothetical protein B0H21DRAFT_824728 [Amylocystis lapponica]